MPRVLAHSLAGFLGLIVLLVGLIAWTVPDPAEVARLAARAGIPALITTPRPPVQSLIRPASARHLEQAFGRLSFDLAATRRGEAAVPRVFVTALPADLGRAEPIGRKKDLFIRTLLPLVLAANEELADLRRRLVALQGVMRTTTGLSAEDAAWLARVKRRYGLDAEGAFAALLERVDVVPVSLALAQAIEESGWGSSRFARHGNALYGQRTYSAGVAGLAPAGAAAGGGFKVRSFMNLLGAVRSYMHNLNTHRAYQPLRKMRAEWRALGQAPDGYVWAGALLLYSERGADYVRRLRAVMRDNALSQFEGLTFSDNGVKAEIPGSN